MRELIAKRVLLERDNEANERDEVQDEVERDKVVMEQSEGRGEGRRGVLGEVGQGIAAVEVGEAEEQEIPKEIQN